MLQDIHASCRLGPDPSDTQQTTERSSETDNSVVELGVPESCRRDHDVA